jgi:hypothetical protein
MTVTAHTAKHLKEVFFGGNWTASNLQDQLHNVSWQQAITHVHSFNTIAALTFHIGYYVNAILKVLQGTPLAGHDKFSFNLPPVTSKEDWDTLISKTMADAAELVRLIEQFPDTMLSKDFFDKKYGNYHRNFNGLIEHTHYHLGQIALIKKIVQQAG